MRKNKDNMDKDNMDNLKNHLKGKNPLALRFGTLLFIAEELPLVVIKELLERFVVVPSPHECKQVYDVLKDRVPLVESEEDQEAVVSIFKQILPNYEPLRQILTSFSRLGRLTKNESFRETLKKLGESSPLSETQ